MKQKSDIRRMMDKMFEEGGLVQPYLYVESHLSPNHENADFKEILKGIADMGAFNEFDGPAIAKFFAKRAKKLYSFRFGLEYSPVLYVRLYENVVEGDAEENAKAHHAFMLEAVAELKADECSLSEKITLLANRNREIVTCEDHRMHEIRLWWD